MFIIKSFKALEKRDILTLLISLAIVAVPFFAVSEISPMTAAASLIGVTSLIFLAKGEPLGQILMIIFSVLYSIISLEQKYYGELITYSGMTLPMAAVSLVSWLRNPYKKGETQVKVERVTKKTAWLTFLFGVAVTAVFYFILDALGTASIFFSTLSVMTSFVAAYLTFCRCAEYALGYAANDVVLIILWILASGNSPSAAAMAVCFTVFLYNDLYGYFSWRRMAKKQST